MAVARSALAVVTAVVLLTPPGLPAAAAELPLLAGTIVFSGDRKGGYDLLALDPTTGQTRNITRTPAAEELDPAWSPDGTRLAFSRKLATNTSADIYVRDATGTELRLTKDFGGPIDRQPAWSPDGARIAWTRSVHHRGMSQIWVMNAGGTGARALTDPRPGGYDSSPAWSPDGTRIAFVSDRGTGFPDLWVMNATGGGRRRLTHTAARIEGNPSWSPDGTRIAFERCCPHGSWDVVVMNANGTGQRRLTRTARNEVQPSWSPLGDRISYAAYPPRGGNKDLFVMDASGASQERLLSTRRADLSPHWTARPALPLLRPADPTDSAANTPSSSSAASSPSRSGRGGLKTVSARTVEPGVRLRKVRFGRSDAWVLRVDPARALTMDVALAANRLPGRERTTRMARRHGAVVAINGDFPLPSGKPSHPFAQDGDVHTTSLAGAHNFAISADERRVRLAPPVEVLRTVETRSGDTWTFDRWNDGAPSWGETAAYSSSGGGSHGRPPRLMCSARLMPQGGRRWARGMQGVERRYRVERVACRADRMTRQGGVVLSAHPGSVGGVRVESLRRGDVVTLSWSFRWKGVADSIGGVPRLVRDGKVVADRCDASICRRHPRTGIGITSKGRILLVVVDGRRKASRGLTLVKFGRLFKRLGAKAAVNLDGGGSSTMVVNGRIVNRPSDGSERAVSSAILVLPGPDRRERIGPPGSGGGGGGGAAAPLLPVVGVSGAGPSLEDPASTGGLLDAMARGELGGRLPEALRPALREFRASR